MLKVFENRTAGVNNGIPSGQTTLSVSLLNNEFRALAVHRGAVVGSMERTGDPDAPNIFENFIRDAVRETGYKGQTVSLLLAHPRLVQQLIELPPVKSAMLSKLVQRQAQQQKFFSGEAAWAFQSCLTAKSERVILHLFPKVLLGQFVLGCKANGLHLTSVIPASAVLHRQMHQLPLEKTEPALLAAETGRSTSLLVARGDGQVLLARTLAGNWNEDVERLALDLNRTILFVNQQYGLAISKGVWLFGQGAQAQLSAVQRQIQIPVFVSAAPYEPLYWATEALKLRANLNPNLISAELQRAPQRRVFAKVVAVSTSVVVAVSFTVAAYSRYQARQEAKTIKALTDRAEQLQAKQRQLQIRDNELTRKKQIIQLVIGERPPPTSAWLLGYLSDALPSDLVVTNLHVKRTNHAWRVQMAGAFQPSIKQPARTPSVSSIERFKAQLCSGPFHFTLMDQPDNQQKPQINPPKANATDGLIPDWLKRVTNSVANQTVVAKAPPDSFVIEGEVR